MSKYNAAEYTFAGLDSLGEPTGGPTFLGYLMGLVDKPDHGIADPPTARIILPWLYDVEEQASDAAYLGASESQFFSRYFEGGYLPQTPCMVTKAWSPLGALLERGIEPVVLRRQEKIRAAATGIWEGVSIGDAKGIREAVTVEELFWALFDTVSKRAKERGMWVSVIAKPGWCYDSAIGSLPKWPSWEVEKAGRVIWQRTPEG